LRNGDDARRCLEWTIAGRRARGLRAHGGMDGSVFFHGFGPPGRALLVGFLAYVALVLLLRLSGKRAIAKMNIFDFVVVVALGSTLASIIVDPGVDLASGLAGLVLLVGVQYAVSWMTAHSKRVERWVNGRPELLFFRGEFIRPAMKRHRVTEEEVRASIRMAGQGGLADVYAVVIETDGVFSVVHEDRTGRHDVMDDVGGFPRHLDGGAVRDL
jgi:uncharacterized membrane protein YcaP (DUF421 family)